MLAEELIVRFNGPFSWSKDKNCPNLFRQDIAERAGLYLWTVPQLDMELIYYVGITGRSFRTRMEEHFRAHCAGAYHLNDPKALLDGNRKCLWPGFFDKDDKKEMADVVEVFEKLSGTIVELLHTYRFYLAPLEVDIRKMERIEGALMKHLYSQEGKVGLFRKEA